MVKKWTVIILCMVFFTGCAAQAQIPPQELAGSILEQVYFQDSLLEAGEELVQAFYILDECVVEYTVYMSSGATAEEIAVLRVQDNTDLEKAVAILEKRLEQQKRIYKDYVPSEMAKLSSPQIITSGNCAVLVVSADPDAGETLDRILKGN